jgi:hypothetical protein
MIHPKDTAPGGAVAPAEPLRRAATALSLGADHARHGTGTPADFAEIDAELARTIDFLLRNRRVEMMKSLAVRASRCHGAMARLLTGETGIDVVQLSLELASIRSAIGVLRLGDDRQQTLATRTAPPAETAAPLQ